MSETRLTLPAFAKINWVLRIAGRRPDDFHELYTIFQTVTLHDRLCFQTLDRERLELECDVEGIPTDETNLVHRAARALREHYGLRVGARIRLEKRIPAQGGLGGGSSDAALTLLALAHLWKIETNREELAAIGARLGADVPFFLTGGTALGTGLGTEIQPLDDVPTKQLVIATPDVGVATAEAYRRLNAPALTKAEMTINLPISRADAQIPDSLCEVMRNDFEPVIFTLRPEIKRVRDTLLEKGARCALMAGSGASVFGIFENGEAAMRAKVAMERETRWRVAMCETLSRDEYRKSLGECAAFM